jgi:hypothetical protein
METISSIYKPADGAAPGAMTAPTAMPAGRPDLLTAQKVEVGIILQAMLGTQAALEYMDSNAIKPSVAARVLNQPELRRGRHDAHGIRVSAA